MGDFWEHMINKSVKRCLRKAIGRSMLKSDKLSTYSTCRDRIGYQLLTIDFCL